MCTASEFMGILVVYFFTVILIKVYFDNYTFKYFWIKRLSTRTGQMYLLFSQYKSSTLRPASYHCNVKKT